MATSNVASSDFVFPKTLEELRELATRSRELIAAMEQEDAEDYELMEQFRMLKKQEKTVFSLFEGVECRLCCPCCDTCDRQCRFENEKLKSRSIQAFFASACGRDISRIKLGAYGEYVDDSYKETIRIVPLDTVANPIDLDNIAVSIVTGEVDRFLPHDVDMDDPENIAAMEASRADVRALLSGQWKAVAQNEAIDADKQELIDFINQFAALLREL
jgi:hypothetical protein